MITVSLSRLDHEKKFLLDGSESPEFLELNEGELLAATHPVVYRLTVTRVSGGVHISGSVSTSVTGECARCLKKTVRRIANDGIDLFFPTGAEETLDITEDIREELLLELPMNILCREDCAGLCEKCGADLNEGPCGCRREKAGDGSGDAPPDTRNPWSALDGLHLDGEDAG